MPEYDYQCNNCSEIITISKSMTDETIPACHKCGSKDVNRVWKKVQLKGCKSTANSCSCSGDCSSSSCSCG